MIRCRPLPSAFPSLQPIVRCLVLVAFVLFPSALAEAQSTATLSGTVADEKGAVIPGAQVTVTNSATGLKREATTNEQGFFTFPLLPPATYSVRAQQTNFAPVEIPNVVLNVGDQKSLQIPLKAGDISEMVQISAEAATISESPAVGTVIDRQFVENIPLNGRSFQTLIALAPGVVLTKGTFAEQGQFSINGQRPDANYYMVDGVSANVGINAGGGVGQAGSGSLPALAATGGFNNLVSVDALQEFRIQTSTYAPEFGRTPGGQISMVTRSGSNDFRLTLFEYFRNDVLDASNWFANANRLPKPALRQNDFGGTFSGPIIFPRFGEGGSRLSYNGRNRTFFFFSYEGLRLVQPKFASTSVPSLSMRQTAPAAVRTLLNGYPIPNGANLANGLATFSATYTDPTTLDATSIRVDHAATNRLTLFGRYNHSPSSTTPRNTLVLSRFTPTEFKTQTLTLGTTWAATPSLSNEFRANLSRQFGSTYSVPDSFGGATPPPDSAFSSFATRDTAQFSVQVVNTPLTFGLNGTGIQRQLNFVDNLSVIKGNHQIKVGFDYRYLFPTAITFPYSVTYNFPTAADVLIGRTTISQRGAPRVNDYQFMNFSAYGQDTWKATSRLTLTYGLRWEVNPPPKGRNDLEFYTVNGLDNPATATLSPKGAALWNTTYGNLAPRVGMAYKLTENGSTVVRGGFGVFYDLGAGAIAVAANSTPGRIVVPPNVVTTYPPNPSVLFIPPLTVTPPFIMTVADPQLKLPYTLQWNAALEHSFGSNQVVTASYVAAAGRRLLRQDRINAPNPTFTVISATRNTAVSDYRSMQLQYQRRLSRGLQAVASYSWARSIDTASTDSANLAPSARINLDQERGPSDFDVRHSFSGALTYNIPTGPITGFAKDLLGGWSVDTIVLARSATPVDVTVSRDLGYGSFAFRPDLVSGIPLYTANPAVAGGRRINNTVAAANPRQVGPFLVPTEARQGTLGRNALRGFPANQVNLAIRRQFNFTERMGLQFRAEVFNVFNHPNFADPAGSLGSVTTAGAFVSSGATFGVSSAMLGQSLGSGGQSGGFSPLYQFGGPRSIQFGLKLSF